MALLESEWLRGFDHGTNTVNNAFNTTAQAAMEHSKTLLNQQNQARAQMWAYLTNKDAMDRYGSSQDFEKKAKDLYAESLNLIPKKYTVVKDANGNLLELPDLTKPVQGGAYPETNIIDASSKQKRDKLTKAGFQYNAANPYSSIYTIPIYAQQGQQGAWSNLLPVTFK